MNKKLLGIVLILLSVSMGFSQERPVRGGGQGMPKICSIAGTIIDAESDSPVEYASISLENLRSNKIVAGALTGSNGGFIIEELAPGKYILKVDFIGYKNYTSEEITLTPRNKDIDLGPIKISQDVSVLDDVTVTAERTYIENKIDKKVVNIGKDLLTAGASATDIMSNIPSVDVDIDGNISLRGNENVRILIDGRPTNMTSEELLNTIPAENIEKVEIITNPSAKYDPDGISGILNIILKKDKKLGFNGSATLGVGSQRDFTGVNKYNGSLNLNYNTGNWNFFANYGYRNRTRESGGEFTRETISADGRENVLEQISENSRDGISHSIKSGFDYSFNRNTYIGYTNNYRISERAHFNNIEYVDPFSLRNTTSESQRGGMSHDLYFKHNFSSDSYLEISAFRDDSDDSSNSIFRAEDDITIYPNESDSNDGSSSISSLQADYYLEKNGYKIEAGIKGQYRNLDSDYKYMANDAIGTPIVDTTRSNHYQFEEQLYSVYTNLGKKWEKWAFQAGLRAEQAYTESREVGGESFENPYFNLFPSIFVTRKLGEQNELGLSYSKRVSRPSSRQLNPAKRYSDTLNIRMGNPFLTPEFTNSIELSFNRYWKGGSFNTAVFFRNTTDKIQRIVLVNENNVSLHTYGNIATSYDVGYEASVMTKIYPWWSLNGSFNIYYTNIDTEDTNFSNNGINWFTRFNNNFNVSKTFSVQLSGWYSGERVIPQGNIDPMYGLNLGMRKTFWNNKASLSLSVRDLFNTFRFAYHTSGTGITGTNTTTFEENGFRKWESRVAYITFTYNFGQKPKKQMRKKNDRRDNGDENGGEMEL